MVTKRKMDSRLLVAHFMNRNMEMLEELDDPKYEGFFLDDSGRDIRLADELMEQISSDLSKNHMRNAFRKAVLVNRMLERIKNTGDE